jgi:outer membrane protein TolC
LNTLNINVNKRNSMKKQIGVVTLAALLCGGVQMQAADDSTRPKTIPVERAVAALRAEETKLEAGKSTLFNVCQVAKDLRAVELQASANTAERIAAHKRHIAMVRDLKDRTDKRIEKGVVASLEGKLVSQELKEAEAELQRAQEKR